MVGSDTISLVLCVALVLPLSVAMASDQATGHQATGDQATGDQLSGEISEEAACTNNGRRPQDDAELKKWLENMVVYHRFSQQEIQWATSLTKAEIESAVVRFDLHARNRPQRRPGDPLLIMPYPGGRHPRIGFLDGALRPQRETKLSVFAPWDPDSYVVVDIPEALWSNLGLTYLAHTHIPTIWTRTQQELRTLEWQVRDGRFVSERRLPNGIHFKTIAKPHREHLQMEMWLHNGSEAALTDLRVQNCVMLRMATGFSQQTDSNKYFKGPYACAKNATGDRWIIVAWEPVHRGWGNAPCPCLHSDPKFPDAKPGETHALRGWLSFFEGNNIDAELRRIDKSGWTKKDFLGSISES